MTNKSTVRNLQPVPPLVLTAQEAVARLVALEAENARLRAGINHIASTFSYHRPDCASRPLRSDWDCNCHVATLMQAVDTLLQEGTC